VPRSPAEIGGGASGGGVLSGEAQVVTASGRDVTDEFIVGAKAALALAVSEDCRFALLTDGSPSCGSSFLYDGSFSGARHEGAGVTAALLREHAIGVYSETQIDALAQAIRDLEG